MHLIDAYLGTTMGGLKQSAKEIQGNMSSRRTYFPIERRSKSAVPRGFQYSKNLITEVEESSLALALGELKLKPFEFRGHLGNRRGRLIRCSLRLLARYHS